MHDRLGTALAALGDAGDDGWVDVVAHHFMEAASGRSCDRAALWGHRAAARAIELAAYEDAIAHAERALRAAGDASDPAATRTRAELLSLLGRARWLAGATAEARRAFRCAIEAAESVGAADVFAEAAFGFVGPTDATPGVNQEGVSLLERALARLPGNDHPLAPRLMARLATELYYGGCPERSTALAEESVAMAERLGDEKLLAYALSAAVYVSTRPSVAPELRLRLAERVKNLAERSNAPDVLALGLQECLYSYLEIGDGAGVEQAIDAYEPLVGRLRQPFLRWLLGLYRGMDALKSGAVAEAERMAHESFALGSEIGTPNALGAFAAQLWDVRSEQGRLHEMDAALSTLAREQPDLPIFRAASVRVAVACGRRREARDTLAALLDEDLEGFPQDQHWLPIVCVLAGAALEVGDAEMARRLESLLEPHAGQMVVTAYGAGLLGAVSHHLGRLAARRGALDRAEERFEAAATIHERLRAPLWLAHTYREHGIALLRGRGDAGRAHDLARLAQETHGRLAPSPRRASERSSTAGNGPSVRSSVGPLTARAAPPQR
jgi:hypothetical protein